MKRLFVVLLTVIAAAGCSVLPPRDFGCVAGAIVGAEATNSAAGAVGGCVAGAALGLSAESRGYTAPATRTGIPKWADPATNCRTSLARDYRTGATTETTRCDASFRRPAPGGYESCFATFESRSTNGGPHEVLRDTERCHLIVTRPGYRAY